LEEKTSLQIRIEACNKELKKLSDQIAEFEDQVTLIILMTSL